MNARLRNLLLSRLIRECQAALPAVDRRTGKVRSGGYQGWLQHLSYPLAWLYAAKLPGNTLHGREEVRELALRVGEYKFGYQTARGGYDEDDATQQGDEWQGYFLLRTLEALGRAGLSGARRRRWTRSLSRYADCHAARPLFFSGPNHDIWKMATVDLAGRVLRRPELRRVAGLGMTQLLRYQQAPGFWEENRHHGPSTAYNCYSADPLYLFWRSTGRRDVRRALERLAGFMARHSLPDGSASGALDGRVPYLPGYAVARLSLGLEATAEGRRMNELLAARWLDAGRPVPTIGNLAWATDLVRFAGGGPVRRLPSESDGHLVEEHDGNFHALSRRQGSWHLTLSGVFSDIPKECDNPFRLERQSRIDLWHEAAGLVIGGGSTHRSSKLHLANLFLDTGYFADIDFGRVAGRFPETARACYYPRLVSVAARGRGSELGLVFGHAQARFECRPVSRSEFAIGVHLESAGVRRAFAGIPIVVARGANLAVDGRRWSPRAGERVTVRRKVAVSGSLLGAPFEVELPAGARARLEAPFVPGFSHLPKVFEEMQPVVCAVALLAVELNIRGPVLAGPVVVRVKSEGNL